MSEFILKGDSPANNVGLPWTPVLQNESNALIRERISIIANYLLENIPAIDGYSLLTGKTGVALFFYYYYQLEGDARFYDAVQHLLNLSINEINAEPNPYFAHCGGLSGVSWCLDFLYEEGVSSNSSTGIFGDNIYDILLGEANDNLADRNYDYLHGAIGILLYLNEKNIDISIPVGKILEMGIEDDTEIKWLSIHQELKELPCYNLSLAHGNLSVLHFLVKVYEKNKSDHLLLRINKLLAFIRRCRNAHGLNHSCFPNYVSDTPADHHPDSRLAWCYGDLGIGFILLKTSMVLNDSGLRKEATDLLYHCAKRKLREETFVSDACFCHGSTGVAHMYSKLAYILQDDLFKKTAGFWYEKSLYYADDANAPGGYRTWQNTGPVTLYSILDGLAGIGLSFISAISDIDPAWDMFMSLS